jgi:hypothetical protein
MRLISGPPGKAMSRCPMFFYLCPVQYVLHICAREAGRQAISGWPRRDPQCNRVDPNMFNVHDRHVDTVLDKHANDSYMFISRRQM